MSFRSHRLASMLLLAVVSSGCALGGANRLPVARLGYNQAIAQSMDEQLLLNLVRLRYRDTPLFLDMNSIVTQYKLERSGSISPSLREAAGDLVGLGAAMSYSETPTIAYSPLRGEQFASQILSPIPPSTIVLLSESGWGIDRLLGTCVNEINGIENAASAAGPTPSSGADNRDFRELSRDLRKLQGAGLVEVTANGTAVQFRFRSSGDSDLVAKVKAALGLDPTREVFAVIPASTTPRSDALALRTRSLLAVLFFLSQTVEAPAEHQLAGKVTVTRDDRGEPFEWRQVTGDLLRVLSSPTRPVGASTSVRYRDYWYYIEDDDLSSKSTFNLLSYLFSLQSASGKGGSPLLTLPAGG